METRINRASKKAKDVGIDEFIEVRRSKRFRETEESLTDHGDGEAGWWTV